MFLYVIRYHNTAALIAAALWICVGLSLGASWLGNETKSELRHDATRYLAEVDRFFTGITSSFTQLSAMEHQACSPDMLRELHRVMLANSYVRDIIYLGDGGYTPLCSATLGVIGEAAALPRPDLEDVFHPEREIWLALPSALFDGEKAYYTVKSGHFAISLDTKSVEGPTTRNKWESFFPSWTEGTPYYPFIGETGLHQQYLDRAKGPIHTQVMYSTCAKTLPNCVTLATPWPEILSRYTTFIWVMLIFVLLSAALLYQFIRRWLCHKASPVGRLESALKRKGGFTCVYQPLVEISSGTPIGCEVLARFEDRLGAIPPDEFVPAIMHIGKTWEFTELMLEMALRDLKQVTDLNHDFKVSVNFYPQDLHVDKLPVIKNSALIQQAARDGVHLNLEVLETGLADTADLSPVLNYMRSKNFTVSIDDFGTGSSNLHQLRSIRANYIKIDRSFVSGLSGDSASIRSSLVHHIVEIANEMQVEIIAEGVESFTQLQILSSLGITYGQGYFFSPPVSIQRLLDYVRTEEALEGVRSLSRAPKLHPAVAPEAVIAPRMR